MLDDKVIMPDFSNEVMVRRKKPKNFMMDVAMNFLAYLEATDNKEEMEIGREIRFELVVDVLEDNDGNSFPGFLLTEIHGEKERKYLFKAEFVGRVDGLDD